MIEFEVAGPFELPTKIDQYEVRHLDESQISNFWKQLDPEKLGLRNGCYIFGMNTKRVKPWYVGKSWIGFRNEIFKPYQKNKIAKFINSHGTPVVFFVFKPYKKKEGAKTKKNSRIGEFFDSNSCWSES